MQRHHRLPGAGLPMSFVRGYTWVDVREGERSLHFVDTHLEAFSSFLALT